MIHAYGPFNKCRMVCINFSQTIIQFSHTRNLCNRHKKLTCSGLTLIFWLSLFSPFPNMIFLNDTCLWTLQQVQDVFYQLLIHYHIVFTHQKCMWKTYPLINLQWFDPHFCGCCCFLNIQTLYFSMMHAYGPFTKFRMVCIKFSLTIIQFSHTRCVCNQHIMLQWFDPQFCGYDCFYHIQTFFSLIIHVYGPFTRFRNVCINFSLSFIQFSYTRNVFDSHMWLIFSGWTRNFFVVAVLTLSKHFIIQSHIYLDPLLSLGMFLSSFH